MFWNKDCENLTEHLCKDFSFHEPHMKESFKCSHPGINFNYFLIGKIIILI